MRRGGPASQGSLGRVRGLWEKNQVTPALGSGWGRGQRDGGTGWLTKEGKEKVERVFLKVKEISPKDHV